MSEIISYFSGSDFVPLAESVARPPGVLWLTVISDLVIGLAYLSIPAALLLMVRTRRDLLYPRMFVLFATFIGACGVVHLTNVWTIWYGTYALTAAAKLIAALTAAPAAVLLWRIAVKNSAVGRSPAYRDTREQLQAHSEERERLTSELRANRDFLENILDNTSSIVFVKDLEGRYLMVNRKYRTALGFEQDSPIGKSDHELFPATFAENFRNNDRKVISTGESIQVEESAPHPDGLHSYISIKFPIRDEKGEIYALGCVATDITALKRVEHELRKANSFMDSIIEHIPDMIFVKDAKELRFVRLNRAGEELLGLPRRDVLGKNDYDFFPKEQADFFTQKDRQVVDVSGFLNIEEEPINTRSQGLRFLHTKKIVLSDEYGTPEYLVGISQDITVEKRAHEDLARARHELEERVAQRTEELRRVNDQLARRLVDLEEAERRFRAAVESSPNAMVMIDSTGRIVLVNAETERLFGYGRSELLGQPADKLLPERFRGSFVPNDSGQRAGPGYGPHAQDLYGLRKDGGEVSIEIGLSPISTSDGEFILSAIVDTTRRRQADNFMRQSLREKDLLLKEIHHRVKNNLQVVSSLLKLQSSYVDDPSTRFLLKQSEDRVRSMALIHERLYRSEEFVQIDFAAYVDELSHQLFRSYAVAPERIALKLSLEKVYLGIDRAIPCGLLLNEAVSNVLKHGFSPDSRGELEISLGRADNGMLFLRVKDSGRGYPEGFDIERPTSLGMEIIRTLAQQLDGTVTARNNGGAELTLQFSEVEPHQKTKIETRSEDGISEHTGL